MEKHTTKEEKLIEGVLQGKNGAQAAREAGYSPKFAKQIASHTLRKPDIQERIKQRIAQAESSQDEVLGTLVAQMRADITDLFDPGECPFLDGIRNKGLGHLIKKVRVRRVYEGDQKTPVDVIDLELHGAQTAAVRLARILKVEPKKPAPLEHWQKVKAVALELAAKHNRPLEEVMRLLEPTIDYTRD